MATLRDYLQVLRRRKALILAGVLIVPLAALAFSLHQRAEYEGSAQVLLSQQDLGNQLTGTQISSYNDPADRQTQTQANLARVPAVAARAIRHLKLHRTPREFLAVSNVTPGVNSDTLTFSVVDQDQALASRLAGAYAKAYVAYRLAVETAPIEAARRGLDARLQDTPKGSQLYDGLAEKEQTLQELEALKTSDASVIRSGGSAVQVAPRTKRNVILGLLLGLLLGVVGAYVRETLDTRVRSAEAIADRLDLPLLARIPEPARRLRENELLAMLEEPSGVQAEAFRMLRTNVEFAMLGHSAQVVMVTSAVAQEGKSTTVANLAVALARAGRRVALVDLDLRRPFLDRFFSANGHGPGVTHVALGRASLGEALIRIPLDGSSGGESGSVSRQAAAVVRKSSDDLAGGGSGGISTDGSLHVLSAGAMPPDPGEFVGTARMTEVLEELRDMFELVLIDSPPLFLVGDGLALSSKVDAVLTVTRMEVVRRPMLIELRRLLERMPAAKLGFVVTGAEAESDYGYGYGYGYGYSSVAGAGELLDGGVAVARQER